MFQAQIVDKKDGSVCFDSGVQNNLITDQGLDMPGFPQLGAIYLCLGSGVVTEPSVADTNLGNQVAEKLIIINTVGDKYADAAGFHISKYGSCEFDNLTAEISELGLRVTSPTGALITRALIKDANGNPTTISVGSGQTLKLTYTLYYYLPYLLNSGVMATPHGDLHWELKINKPHTDAGASNLAGGISYGWGWAYGGSNDLYRKFMAASSLDELSETIDIPNRKKTLTGKSKVFTSDTTITAGNIFWDTGKSRNNSAGYSIYVTQDYTIPANHDFSMSVEMTWGRLP